MRPLSLDISPAAIGAAAELAPYVKEVAGMLGAVAEELFRVTTYTELEECNGAMDKVAEAVSGLANKLSDAVHPWEVGSVDDINKIIAATKGVQFVRVIVSGVQTLHQVKEIVTKLDDKGNWDVTNIHKLKHVHVIAQAIMDIVKAIPADGRRSSILSIFGNKKRKTTISDGIEAITDHGAFTGVDFASTSDQVLERLVKFLEATGGRTAAEYVVLRTYLTGVLNEPVIFVKE